MSRSNTPSRTACARCFASDNGPRSRKNTRHTTHHHHLDGFPEQVRVIRPRHPLEGQALAVLGWSHRQGRLHLLLVLPDGSRSLIPACWTDLETAPDKALAANAGQQARLGSLSQLLHTRRIVDALLQRGATDQKGPQSGGEEWKGGANEPARTAAAQRQRGSLEHTLRPTKSRSDSDLGPPDCSGRNRPVR
jgi:hypothetical protein